MKKRICKGTISETLPSHNSPTKDGSTTVDTQLSIRIAHFYPSFFLEGFTYKSCLEGNHLRPIDPRHSFSISNAFKGT